MKQYTIVEVLIKYAVGISYYQNTNFLEKVIFCV